MVSGHWWMVVVLCGGYLLILLFVQFYFVQGYLANETIEDDGFMPTNLQLLGQSAYGIDTFLIADGQAGMGHPASSFLTPRPNC